MKKRLLCLLLCLVTVLVPVLASCSKKTDEEAAEDITAEASESAITLRMWVVSPDEHPVTPEDDQAVTDALNLITKAKFKTQLDLQFYTKSEYESKLSEAIIAYSADRANQKVEVETEAETGEGAAEAATDEMVTDDLGLSVIDYPDVLNNQVDIIYIAGEDMYMDFIDKGWLAALDSELSTSAKKIKEYVSGTLLSAAKVNGTTYAIPNNRVIGDYTYMMVNKELVDKYSQTGYIQHGQINGFYNSNLYTFLNMVKDFGADSGEVPIEGTYEQCLDLLAHYWSIDSETFDKLDEFSAFGSHYKDIEELSRGSVALGYGSLFADKAFADAYLQLNKFKFGGYFHAPAAEGSTPSKVAVKFVTGTSSEVLTYNATAGEYEYVEADGTAYYPIVVKYPTATTEDIYGNMFGVASISRSVSRSMDIITYLNTNVDFRNILQYGVDKATIDKNTVGAISHYEIIKDDNGKERIERLDGCQYIMDLYATGNTFLAYLDPTLQLNEDVWESGKVQNRDSLVEPMLGLNFAGFASTTASATEDTSIPKSLGFLMSYSTGYTKETLSANPTLKAWIDSCDAAGGGVYVLPVQEISGANAKTKYYVYNNATVSAVNFSATYERLTETVVNKKKTEIVQRDLDFFFNYEATSGVSKGYDLSVVDIYTKKTNQYDLRAMTKSGDSSAEMTVTVANPISPIVFDMFHTDSYSIDYYASLKKPTVSKNDEVAAWLVEKDKKTGNFVYTYKEERGDKVEYTYLIYKAYSGKTAVSTQVVPVKTANGLTLSVQFTEGYTGEEVKYLLHYIRVVVDKNTNVDLSLVAMKLASKDTPNETNTATTTNLTAKTEKLNKTDYAGNSRFTMLGTLDTELIKYLAELNQDVLAAINACTTYEELETLVRGLQILLTPAKTAPVITEATVGADIVAALKPLTDKYAVIGEEDTDPTDDFEKLNKYLNLACAITVEAEKDEEGTVLKDSIFTDEEQVLLDSPNAMYYKWLEKYGFKPAEQK